MLIIARKSPRAKEISTVHSCQSVEILLQRRELVEELAILDKIPPEPNIDTHE